MSMPEPSSAAAQGVTQPRLSAGRGHTAAVPIGQRWGEYLYFTSIVLAVVPFGAVHAIPLGLSAVVTCLVLVLSLGRAVTNPAIGRLIVQAAGVAALLTGWLLVQSLSAPDILPSHPAWRSVERDFGAIEPSISINPNATAWSLIDLATPFLSFVSALILFGNDTAAARLWRFLRLFGLCVTIFGLAQFLILPNTILIFEKWTYQGSLTATFVNRNSAATFLGLVALLWFAEFLGAMRRLSWRDLAERLGAFRWGGEDGLATALRAALATFLSLGALFLSTSRGGFIATAIGFLVVFIQMSRGAPTDRASSRWHGLAGLGLILAVFALFGGLALQRLQVQGADDSRLCAYLSTLSAIRDNWLFGTGFGTFADIFPLYRDPACASIEGVWDRAHNSYLEATLGLGLGFVVLLVFVVGRLVSILRQGIASRRRNRHIVAGGFGALALVASHALVDFSIQIHGVAMYWVATMAVSTAIALGRSRVV
ncbi:hypothetical protein ABB55_06400 [Prosthecomicrobium hirschii]|uniref:O-antigen ligase-related domain-containing protein n=1 Tax=Prosthecodimorpha hirschii TaxID=665126 RepID=A0A0P6WBD5_9HYPH|nr:O-antigen ligase family protein [Prosthecomicrobium hirschii]KPL51901.1 hypothetical protein ABB55_06400 [Prosthecomicrobium hirschii]